MGKRQREWARSKRDELFLLLEGCCCDCGTTKNLQFDVICPTGNDKHHRKMDWSWRMSFYRRQFDMNNLALRCEKCNNKKGNDLRLNPNLVQHPF